MQVAIEEIRGRIKALKSQIDFENGVQSDMRKALEASVDRQNRLIEVANGYIEILKVTGKEQPRVYRQGGGVETIVASAEQLDRLDSRD